MTKLQAMAKASNYKMIVEENPYKAYEEGYIDAVNMTLQTISELIEGEAATLKDYAMMTERRMALKMYHDRIMKFFEDLKTEITF